MPKFNFLLFFVIMVFLIQCSGQTNSAVEAQKLANEVGEKTAVPGVSPNSNLFMRAVIDGKKWEADKLIPDDDPRTSSYHVYGTYGGTAIAFYVSITRIKAGDKHAFSESNASDFMTDDDIAFYGGRTGNFEVTKADDKGFEGRFYFTASSVRGPKKFEVTDGELRFPWAKSK